MCVRDLVKLAMISSAVSLAVGCGEDTLDEIVCAEDEIVEDGFCLPMCTDPWVYDQGGCICKEDFEDLDGQCVPICDTGYHLEDLVCEYNCESGWLWENDECHLQCDAGLTAVGDECLLVCDPGEEIVLDGATEICLPVCEVDTERVGLVCLPVCAPGTIRVGLDCLAVGTIEGAICNYALGAWRAGVTVSITLVAGGELSTTTNAAGYFRLEQVPPGVYTVQFSNPADGFANTLPAQVNSGEVTFIGDTFCALPPGHLAGAVCDLSSETWVEGADVRLNDLSFSGTTSAADGSFMFHSIAAGSYDVTITYPDATVEVRPATVISGQLNDIGPATCEQPPGFCDVDYPTADAGPDQEAIPDQTVQLDGTNSSDPTGQTITFEWRVAGRPIGSTATFSNPNAPNPTILADVSGDFSICLVVTDSDGCASDEDCMALHVVPDAAFHVELVWDTNQVDVDLHLTHPGGSWFDSLTDSDCYYLNTTPDWGPAGADGVAMNDPHLDVDNWEGYGPENINMGAMWDDGPFVVGAHYWSETGGGPTVCRIRIYVLGVMQYEAYSNPMVDNDFWEVANVDVSNGGTSVMITPVDNYFVH